MSLFKARKLINSHHQPSGHTWQLNRQVAAQLTRDTAKRSRYFFLVLSGLVLFSYMSWQVWQVFSPPELTVDEPSEDTVVKSGQITIRGRMEPAALLTLNNETVLPDTSGNFLQDVRLQPGVNILVLEARKRYGWSVRVTRRVHFKSGPVVQSSAGELSTVQN